MSQVEYAIAVELRSKREAAEILGLSTRGVERAVRRGQLAVLYRDSKHGRKAWFRPQDLTRYRQRQQLRGPVGFTSGVPPRGPGSAPTVGTLIPMVETEPSRHRDGNAVPLADRLMLTLDEATQVSGLPRSFLAQNIRSGKLKTIRIGRSHYVKRSDLQKFVQIL